jgi:hypothetical protein
MVFISISEEFITSSFTSALKAKPIRSFENIRVRKWEDIVLLASVYFAKSCSCEHMNCCEPIPMAYPIKTFQWRCLHWNHTHASVRASYNECFVL